ncbi:ParE family toxin-like protein [Aeromonas veronii]|uniref:ParE family toxin-like protein n=1 Tax=Aeromonas veronii TaxID=654 RepID=UPI003DA66C16
MSHTPFIFTPEAIERTQTLLDEYRNCEVHARRLIATDWLVLLVGFCWYLLSRDRGQLFELLSHEKCNRFTAKNTGKGNTR